MPKTGRIETWAEGVQSYLGFLEGTGKSGNTIRNYRSDLSSLDQFLRKQRIHFKNFTETDFRTYSEHLAKFYPESNTRRRKLLTAKSFYDYLLVRKKLRKSPAKFFSPPPRNDYTPYVPSQEEIHQIGEYLKKKSKSLLDTPLSELREDILLRDRALFGILIETGLKVSEVVALHWEQIEGKTLKTKYGVRFPLSDFLVLELEKLEKKFSSFTPYLFWGSNRYGLRTQKLSVRGVELIVARVSEELDLPDLKPRSFRHSAALKWLKEGVSEAEVLNRLNLINTNSLDPYRKLLARGLLLKEEGPIVQS